MFKTEEGSTGRLLQLCLFYFLFYTVTGVAAKYFTPKVGGIEYMAYSTIGGTLLCLMIVFVCGWYRLKSSNYIKCGKLEFPKEILYIIPSGVCTAVVIPTTTLLYTLPISVMVAMVIMRGSIIVISRIIDAIQIHQGILKRKVYWEEEFGVVFALVAVGTQLFFKKAEFDFIHNVPAMVILGSYLLAYFIRLYIMNYYKNTRPKDAIYDYKGFFGVEQLAASCTILLTGLALFYLLNFDVQQLVDYKLAFMAPHAIWPWEILAGMAFGAVAFFSVFIFMFKGRTATFAGLVNRLTSLVAGTGATIIVWLALGDKFPELQDWLSLVFILIAVGFLTKAEKKRTQELKREKELK